MYLLDTNIISESRKLGSARIDRNAAHWFTQVDVVLVMLLEHALLLFLGLGIGTLAALVSVLPLEHSTATRWGVLALLQGGMFFFGLMVCVASLWSIRTNNFVAAMRKE